MNTAQRLPLVVITGSSGLIGSRLISGLNDRYQIVGLDYQEPSASTTDFHWIKCDLTNDQSVADALSTLRGDFGSEIASVLHLAAYYDFAGEPSPMYDKLTVEGTRRLLRQLQSFAVEQFVFSSTLLVMKPTEEKALTSRDPEQAEWDYPQSKLAAEEAIRNERGAIPALILRIAGVYDDVGHSIPLAQQLSRIYEKQLESYVFPGDKSRGQSFIHLDDLVHCFRMAIERRHELPDYQTLLIGEADVMSYEELQNRMGELVHGSEWTTMRIPKFVAKAGAWAQNKMSRDEDTFIKPWMIDLADQNYPVDIEEARRYMKWEPAHSLRQTLPRIVQHLSEAPSAWYETHQLPVPATLQRRNEEE